MTGFFGALAEAWDELRVHKLRVLLALIGVAVAVCAITTITAAGDMLRQVSAEANERWSGRPATLTVSAYPTGAEMPGSRNTSRRTTTSRSATRSSTPRWSCGPRPRSASRAGPGRPDERRERRLGDHAPVRGRRRTVVHRGRRGQPLPALVVNQAFLDALGQGIEDHPTVMIGGANSALATIVGSYPDTWPGEEPAAYMLVASQLRWAARSR
ncbi:hypothetical protein NKG05_04185 [Oerskovia sp. M15]